MHEVRMNGGDITFHDRRIFLARQKPHIRRLQGPRRDQELLPTATGCSAPTRSSSVRLSNRTPNSKCTTQPGTSSFPTCPSSQGTTVTTLDHTAFGPRITIPWNNGREPAIDGRVPSTPSSSLIPCPVDDSASMEHQRGLTPQDIAHDEQTVTPRTQHFYTYPILHDGGLVTSPVTLS